jgi:hypothetical protein
VVLYGCENWSLTLREEQRLSVFENRVLRRIFGPKRDAIVEGYRKLHNEGLRNLQYSPNIIRMMKSRMMRWTISTHCREDIRFWWESQKKRVH